MKDSGNLLKVVTLGDKTFSHPFNKHLLSLLYDRTYSKGKEYKINKHSSCPQ